MKKLIPLFALLMVLAMLTGCKKTVYSKEFAYLPSYGSEAQLTSSAPAKGKQLASARYTVKNTTDQKVYQHYMNLLKGDGWKITQKSEYYAITATKGSHLTILMFQSSGKDVLVVVNSK